MTLKKAPLLCPSCGEEGSLVAQGNEFVCNDPDCGRAFPINPKYGLKGAPKRKRTPKKTK